MREKTRLFNSETICSTSNLIKKPEQRKGFKTSTSLGLEKGCSCSGEKTQNWSNKGGKIARKARLYRMFKAVISWQKR